MKRTTLDLADETFAQIDAVRGDVPRNRWITRAIETALGQELVTKAVKRAEPRKTIPDPVAVRRRPTIPDPTPIDVESHRSASCPHPPGRREKHSQGTLCRACMSWLS